MANIVGVRLKSAGKIFYFDAGDLELDAEPLDEAFDTRFSVPANH